MYRSTSVRMYTERKPTLPTIDDILRVQAAYKFWIAQGSDATLPFAWQTNELK